MAPKNALLGNAWFDHTALRAGINPATTCNGLDITDHAQFYNETGGDYFDYFSVEGLQDSTLAVAVGDAVGHGVEAAMLMATEVLAEVNCGWEWIVLAARCVLAGHPRLEAYVVPSPSRLQTAPTT